MRVGFPLAMLLASFALLQVAGAQNPPTRLVPEDLYLLAGPQTVMVAPQGEQAAVIYRRVDAATKAEQFSLWLIAPQADLGGPLETDEPDARTVTYSPDGKWLAVRSTRPRPAGWKPTPPVPIESDPATDIWLISTDGKTVLPLAGPDKPYGRAFADSFYGRVAFSPDGRRLAFIADDGKDPRTPAEIEADVQIVRPDQGEGYTGFGTAQLWVAELDNLAGEPREFAASRIRRLTDDDVWYADPQWTPDGRTLICTANKSSDVESVRYSINKNYDLWAIDADTGSQRRLTFGPGPEVSPRVSPDGKRLVCLTVPRRGPHSDIYSLLLVSLDGDPRSRPEAQLLHDHHADLAQPAPHPTPSFPLPEECWDGPDALVYNTPAGIEAKQARLDLTSNQGVEFALDPAADLAGLSPLVRRMVLQKRLSPPGNTILNERFKAEERVARWKNEWDLEGLLTLPPPEVAQPPYPLIVYPHGGPHGRNAKGFSFTTHVFAHAGYAVFQPNFRGSTGYGRKFLDADNRDLGGGDMHDILTGVDSLVKDGLVDPKRQFVHGVSYGGYMTTWLVGHTNQFRAAVAQNAVTEMNVMWGLSDLQSWTRHELGGWPWEVAPAMHDHSPFHFAGQVETPTLILHAADDRRCPIAMGRMFHQALLARGVPTQMVVYPHENHAIKNPKRQVDVLQRTLAWFAAHDVTAPVEIITLGDSITKGVRPGVTDEETFASVVENNLKSKGIEARVTNAGIGGERTDQALARLKKDIIAQRPRLVTIMYGTNDSYVDRGRTEPRLTRDEYRDNLVQLVESLRRAGIQPVLMTEPRWGAKAGNNGRGEHPNVLLEAYVTDCREVAKELNVPLVDHYSHWAAAEKGGQDLGAWTTDQCHPNPVGHRQLADLIVPVVLKTIGRSQPE